MWQARPIFISSTFADMQAERDYLRTHVFLELEERLRERRRNLEWVDLRMGVATASLAEGEERELRVLKVCLAEVKRCRPFLLVLLGDRYGWAPPPERVKAAAAEEGFAANLQGCSVTALEIDFGVLSDLGQQPRSYFYFRKPLPYADMPPEVVAQYTNAFDPAPKAAAERERLQKLKERITAAFPDRVREYSAAWDQDRNCVTGLEAWGRQVLDDLWADLDAETSATIGAPEPSWQEAERDALDDYIEDRARGFVGRQAVLGRLLQHAASPDRDGAIWGVCLTGEPGSGKSAIFGELVRRLRASGAIVIAHAASASVRSHSVESMLLRWIEELATALGTDPGIAENADPNTVNATFRRLLESAAAQRRVVIIADALDQFETTAQGRQVTWLPHSLPNNARFIATAVSGEASELLRQRAGCEVMALGPLDEAEARDIAEGICARYHRKLEPEVLTALLSKRAEDTFAWGNPLWLVLAVEELNLLDADDFERARQAYDGAPAERLRALMIDIVNNFPVDIPTLYQAGFKRAGELFGLGLVITFIGFIEISRSGWRESDFRSLLPKLADERWDELRFASLRRLFRGQVRARGRTGQWDFAHAQMRLAAKAFLATIGLSDSWIHGESARHLLELPREDPLRKTETMVHLIGAQDWKRAALFYGDPRLTKAESDGAARVFADGLLVAEEAGLEPIQQILDAFEADPGIKFLLGEIAKHFIFDLNEIIEDRVSRELLQKFYNKIEVTFDRLLKDDPSNEDWQHCIGICNERIGDLLIEKGDLNGALERFKLRRDISSRLAGDHPGSDHWRQRELFVSYTKLGKVCLNQGKLADALNAFREGLAIAERLTHADPNNIQWQRDLSVAYAGIGDAFTDRRIPKNALTPYQSSLAIVERLAKSDPGDVALQRDLSGLHLRIGIAFEELGQLNDAMEAYRAYLGIMERVAWADPGNNLWQRDLSAAYEKVGYVLMLQGVREQALEAYRAGLAIIERLAKNDPTNAYWQYHLSILQERIGDILKAQGNLSAAIEAYRINTHTMARLAEADHSNVPWQRNTAVCYERLGDALSSKGFLSEAMEAYRGSAAIRERCAKAFPENLAWRFALGSTLVRIAGVQRRQGVPFKALLNFVNGLTMMIVIIFGLFPKVIHGFIKFYRTGTLDRRSDLLR